MSKPAPAPDDRSYEQVRDELLARIPVDAPEWTDHDVSDPGVTLLELFAFLAEGLLKRPAAGPGWSSEPLAEVRRRLEGRLESIELEEKRVRRALERIKAVQYETSGNEGRATRSD